LFDTAELFAEMQPHAAPYVPPTQEELEAMAAAAVREQRDYLLAQSDWTQLPDVPDATKTMWATYRQALRDITAQPGFPQDVTWPEKPAT